MMVTALDNLREQIRTQLIALLAQKAELQVVIDKHYAVLEGIKQCEQLEASLAQGAANDDHA